ncbi:hypothetical protein [Vreelandella neptunia]|uniref:DUF4760 domain-containing protein n=1 Tax=Vreelandella neptunia TaxID=115551 RepID=A0ABS9SBE1_9GAMM|nr:hypothetical protein [Halomonas neptunia]MCH4813429.1 hypothetical protein [Halomonas neptunia]
MSIGTWIEVTNLALGSLTLFSVLIAFLAYRANVKKQEDDRVRERDRELTSQAKNSFQWAYEVLTDNGANIPPVADRLNWLTAARHLLRAKKLGEKVTHSTYKIIFDEIEEYWRHKFYVALSHEPLRRWRYFADDADPDWPENIEISSALVIVDFSNWKDDVEDPTNNVDRAKMIQQGVLNGQAGRGLKSYMQRFEEIRAQWK